MVQPDIALVVRDHEHDVVVQKLVSLLSGGLADTAEIDPSGTHLAQDRMPGGYIVKIESSQRHAVGIVQGDFLSIRGEDSPWHPVRDVEDEVESEIPILSIGSARSAVPLAIPLDLGEREVAVEKKPGNGKNKPATIQSGSRIYRVRMIESGEPSVAVQGPVVTVSHSQMGVRDIYGIRL
jgi:hypothetical protein